MAFGFNRDEGFQCGGKLGLCGCDLAGSVRLKSAFYIVGRADIDVTVGELEKVDVPHTNMCPPSASLPARSALRETLLRSSVFRWQAKHVLNSLKLRAVSVAWEGEEGTRLLAIALG